LIFFIIYN